MSTLLSKLFGVMPLGPVSSMSLNNLGARLRPHDRVSVDFRVGFPWGEYAIRTRAPNWASRRAGSGDSWLAVTITTIPQASNGMPTRAERSLVQAAKS
jgi:hypothetical protein